MSTQPHLSARTASSDDSQPLIAVLATGGTIAGVQAAATASSYVAGSISVEQLMASVPQLAGLARLRTEQVANVGSQNMTHAVWQALAARVDMLDADDEVQGIVITHGTDTLEETAFFLGLTAPARKPLVLVGAMRPATALSPDGPANLYAAVALARHRLAKGRGPLVVMNGDIHAARDVQKVAASGINAFASPNGGRVGVMVGVDPLFHGPAQPAPERYPLDTLGPAAQWPRVAIVHAHADLQADVVDALAALYDGLVLAGVGDGNATDAAIDALKRAAAQGVAVVRASRTGSGYVGRGAEIDDDQAGFVAAGDLSPQKARVLLMLALTRTRDPARLQAIFDNR
ncbi:asparaginase [Achromobacter aloeverae]|uniref:L-asparaginase n=1 Tax=Achromobacter aloeverae TaxID=1750518 RepID=A0A4Q1HH18_9BURK|nr:asparaginase [Achromobacter aloeverae]RXN86655.1 L-asparaginase [Achromobacter aloeverae]